MSKSANDTKALIRLVAIMILAGLIISVFVSVITTEVDKNDTKIRMSEISAYVKNQCIRYEELAAEETTKELYDLVDKAFEVRDNTNFAAENLEEELSETVLLKRITGIFVTDDENPSAYYSNDEITADYWKNALEKFGSVAAYDNKSYSERYTGTDGYYYDYAMVARTDKKGVVLCYKRQRIDEVEGAQFSVATLLHGYYFEKNGVITVTDGTMVIASSVREYEGMTAAKCPVVRNIRRAAGFGELTRVDDDGVYYGMRTKSKNYFVYVYLPDSEVFTNRSLIMSYTMSCYMLLVIVVLVIWQRLMRSKRLEQERKDKI